MAFEQLNQMMSFHWALLRCSFSPFQKVLITLTSDRTSVMPTNQIKPAMCAYPFQIVPSFFQFLLPNSRLCFLEFFHLTSCHQCERMDLFVEAIGFADIFLASIQFAEIK